MHCLETYLRDLSQIRAIGAGLPETSYYPALSNLFDEVGKQLKPKVRCVINITSEDPGIPDGGFFTPKQFQKQSDSEPKAGQLPERGAMEVKGTDKNVDKVAQTKQVKKYLRTYGLVLVTNLRDFLIVGQDETGRPSPMEAYSLAVGEADFWQNKAAHPRATAHQQGAQFVEFLKRAMLHAAPVSEPRDVAWFLGSYARDAIARVEGANLPALVSVREALEEALGMKFTGEKGEHFFRSTLVQTIFYGVFSAWVLWHREHPYRSDAFKWRESAWYLRVPFIRALYDEIATPSKLGALGLVEVLNWTGGVLNRVNRTAFFESFQDEHAVQYFYEPFMEAYDPELRKELGVWYTPLEIVRYQVARIDTVLREELHLADGLADGNVVVLDPCCGTGAYLVEVLKRIAEILKAKGGEALIGSDLKKAAMTRVFGFEIMPAPFVVSHLQLSLMLHGLGAPLSPNGNERVGVYLTNSLTGWEASREDKPMPWSELEQERKSSGSVKRDKRILVVLGNPPYNAFAGVSPKEEQGLVEPYKGTYEVPRSGKRKRPRGKAKIQYDSEGHAIPEKTTVTRYELNDPVSMGGWGIKKFNLDDLYVRFFRIAERRIAEMTGKGVVSFISNFSYLGDPSFVVMRERFLAEFDRLWFDCMNGDSRETGKLTPEGDPDPSVFSTKHNRAGIRVGTAICVVVRKSGREPEPLVRFRHFWGVTKRQDLLDSLGAAPFDAGYTVAKPCRENRYSFRPENVSADYRGWPKLPDLCDAAPLSGPIERRGNSLIVLDAKELSLVQDYLDAGKTDDEIRLVAPAFMKSSGEFQAESARTRLKGKVAFNRTRIREYPFKPFDIRVAYLDPEIQPLFSRPAPELLHHSGVSGNRFFITRDTADKTREGPPFYYSALVCDYDFISGHARHFPVLLGPSAGKTTTMPQLVTPDGEGAFLTTPPKANLSALARAYLSDLGIREVDACQVAAEVIWMHALAIGYSPAYLSENADGIRRDWPRMPLPDSRKALEASAALGRSLAALLNTEGDVPGVTAGNKEPIMRVMGVLSRVGGGALDPDAGELALTEGWGHAGKAGATMPGKGHIEQRPYSKAELEAIRDAAKARGLSAKEALALLGADTRDVYLNDNAYWRNVPANVWDYYIGGYQVIKKWLSYREEKLLGRGLTAGEAREVIGMTRRLAAIILLQPALDENYCIVKQNAYDWPKEQADVT